MNLKDLPEIQFNEEQLIAPHELNDGESAIIVEWGDNTSNIKGKTWFRKGDKFGIKEIAGGKEYWDIETVKHWNNCKVKRILKPQSKDIMPESSFPPNKKIKFD